MSATDGLVTPSIQSLTPYVLGKPIEEVERELGIFNAVKLVSNENPLGASPRALAASVSRAMGSACDRPVGAPRS